MADEQRQGTDPALPDAWCAWLRQLRRGEPQLLVMESDNLVARPWGGRRLLEYKGLAEPPGDRKYGEAFEVSAYPADEEAAAFPSRVCLDGSSAIELVRLLEAAGPELLGPAHLREHGAALPVLPKTLDVVELLSVQAHPPGQLELYVVLDCEPGATARLGFRRDVDPRALGARLLEGRGAQEALLGAVPADSNPLALHDAVAPWLAKRDAASAEGVRAVEPLLRTDADRGAARQQLSILHSVYWQVLDLMNEIPLRPGLVILNATPLRLAAGGPRSAEIHALGNPERRESLMLEIRRPGITLRAWDNVRFPLRPIDVAGALGSANLQATTPDELTLEPEPLGGHPGALRLLESARFNVHSLRPRPGAPVPWDTAGRPHTLHVIRGQVQVRASGGAVLASLDRGRSAMVPACVGGYDIVAAREGECEVIQVDVPAER